MNINVALSALAMTTSVHAATDICSVDISKCYIDGGSKTCDREKAVCPPCLEQMDSGLLGFLSDKKYACNQLNDDNECPDGSKSCSSA